MSTTLSLSALTLESDLPIALRKGMRSTHNPSPHYIALSYHRCHYLFYTCLSSISSVTIPKTIRKALAHPGWRQAMTDELSALHKSGAWELVPLPFGKSIVGCRWVFAIKVGTDGTIDHLKAHLVAKDYTQIFGLDYGDTFFPRGEDDFCSFIYRHGCCLTISSSSIRC